MTENRYGDAPLGKSVEEVQDETGNRVNSPMEGEVVRDGAQKVVPAVVNSNTSGTPVAVVNPDALEEGSSGADDGTARPNRDSSQE